MNSLPLGITRQTFERFEGSTLKKRVEIGNVTLAKVPEEFPFLLEIDGRIVGVGFEPGKPEVCIRGDATAAIFGANAEQVDAASALSHDAVRVFGVHNGKHACLLRIRKSSELGFVVTPEAIEEHILQRWEVFSQGWPNDKQSLTAGAVDKR